MTTTVEKSGAPYALGLTSLALGAVALLLFFMPVLGLPLAGAGLLFGLIALFAALFGGRSSLRWAVLGIALSLLALAADFAVALAPAGYLPHQAQPRTWQPPAARPYVPPPADPGFWSSPYGQNNQPSCKCQPTGKLRDCDGQAFRPIDTL
jgi:hypothetical protein